MMQFKWSLDQKGRNENVIKKSIFLVYVEIMNIIVMMGIAWI